MRVDEKMRKCVVFVGTEAGGRFVATGTGFIGGVRHEGFDNFFLVTASHVLDDMAADTFSMRINRRSGPAESVKLDRRLAVRHTNLANDIAIVPIPLDPSVHDVMAFGMKRSWLENRRKEFWDVALGDEVCAIGLYTSHYGLEKNIPVLRIGNLAMMPEEPVRGPKGYVQAYLIELRTIAGLSGSPVFIIPPPVAVKNKQLCYRPVETAVYLGVLVAYHVVESKEDQVQVPRFQQPEGADEDEKVDYSLDERNTGFGIVIPIERVYDILERDDVQKNIKSSIERVRKAKGVKPASASVLVQAEADDGDDDGRRERFNRLLGAAVKPPKSGGQT